MSRADTSMRNETDPPEALDGDSDHTTFSNEPDPECGAASILDLRSSKIWSPKFFAKRKVFDRPFVDTVTRPKLRLGLLAVFLQSTNASGPSWEVEQVQRMCKKTPEEPDAPIWIDDRHNTAKTKHSVSKWITSADLDDISQLLVDAEASGHTIAPHLPGLRSSHNVRRRLTFVPRLTPNIIEGLVRSSSWFEAQNLRPAIRQHIAGGTSIRVFIPVTGFEFFRLEFHIPYLFLENQVKDEQCRKLRGDLSFLPIRIKEDEEPGRYSIFEAQTTVSISGAHHFDWHGYAFGYPGPRNALAEEDDGNDDEEGPEEFFEEEEDFFATGGCESIINPRRIIWDPRVYFLRTLQLRLAVVVQSHVYLVQTLVAGVDEWEVQEKNYLAMDPGCDASQDQDEKLRLSLAGVANIMKLFQVLHERFSKANTTWKNFSSRRGDMLYFADLHDSDSRGALHKIEESFETMAKLEMTLIRLQQDCEQSAKILALHLSHESHGMSRVMLRTNTQVVKLTEAATVLAAKSQRIAEDTQRVAEGTAKIAEDTGRATRVNVQLLMVTTAVVIALQYFCSERALFSWERNVRSFWMSISVMIPSLLLLTFALSIFDRFQVAFTNRLKGQIDQAAHPPLQRSTSLA